MTRLAPVMEGYFTDWLAARQSSPHTVASYRDCYRLLLRFAQARTGTAPCELDLAQLDAGLIGAFLEDLEVGRANAIRSRNLRLGAIHSLYRYAALRCPEHAGLIQRVLAIPTKRAPTSLVNFLDRAETEALLAAPDRNTALGQRDYALLAVAVQSGLRVSELTGLSCGDVTFGAGANLYCRGKGRKERRTPLTVATARLLAAWVHQRRASLDEPLFPARSGNRLSTDAVADLVEKYARACPCLETKKVTPHTLRHTCAMNLLQAGIDTATVALWLGHSSIKATQVYRLFGNERGLTR
jgi:integrase/recombinase XerD